MSGGAFNYAYYSIREKLDELAAQTLPEMLEWMKTHQVNPEAVEAIRLFLGHAAALADESSQLHDLLRAIEWQASGDSCEIDKEVEKLKQNKQWLERCRRWRFT